MFDRDLKYIAASAEWLAGFGLEQTPLGRGHTDMFPEFSDACAAIHRGCLAVAGRSPARETIRRATGEVQWLRWSASPWIGPDGVIGGVVVASEDLTPLVEAERRAESLARRCDDAVRRAEEAERRLGDAIALAPGAGPSAADQAQLARETALLETTLTTMGEGIAVFGPDKRLVMSNRTTTTMLAAPDSLARVGTPLEAHVRFRAMRGDLGHVDPDTAVADSAQRFQNRTPWADSRSVIDGRVIDTRFNPSSDGGGIFLFRDITERAAAEASLAEKTRQLEATLHNIGEGIAVFGPDLKLRMWNDLAAQLLDAPELARAGADFEDVVRLRAAHGDFGDVDAAARVRQAVDLFRGGRAWSRTERRPNGLVLEVRFQPLPDGGGAYVLRDVTERAEQDAKLAEKTRLLQAALENMGEGFSVYGPDLTLLIRSKIVVEILDLPPALLKPLVTFPDIARFRARRGDLGDGDVETIVASRVAKFRALEPWSETRRDHRGRAIELRFNPTPEGGGVFMFRDVTERADAEARLAQRNTLLEATFESMGEGILVYDAHGRLVARNHLAPQLAAAAPASLFAPGAGIAELIRLRAARSEDGDTEAEAAVRRALDDVGAGRRRRELRVEPDGRAVESRMNPMPGGGVIWLLLDVTERVQREAEDARKTALLEATLESTGDGIAVFGPDLRLLTYNKTVADLFRAPATIPSSLTLVDVVRFRAARGEFGAVDAETIVRQRVEQFRAQKRWSARVAIRRRVIELHFNPMPDKGGVYVLRDVTERADAEEKLAERTALLEATLESIGEGIAVYGSDLRLRMCNAIMEEMLGTPPGFLAPGVSRDDVLRFRAARGDFGEADPEQAVRERSERFHAREPASQMRTMHDGRRVEAHFRPMPDGGGMYVLHDVTESERSQTRIREEEAKFRSVVEQDVAGIVIVRDDGTIAYSNDCFAAMLGYERADVVDRRLLDFVPPDQRPVIMGHLRAQLFETGAPVQITSTIRAGDGAVIEVLVSASRSTVEGRPVSVAVVLDVTSRNKAQRELMSAAAILAAVHESSPDGILAVDPAGRVLSVNRRFGDLFRAPARILAEADERPVLDAIMQGMPNPEAFLARVRRLYDHPDASAHDELALKDGRVLDRFTSPLKSADGEHLGRIWFYRDISERRSAEASLRASEARFRMLFEEAPDGILLLDLDRMRFVAANKAAERLFGASRDEICEHGALSFYPSTQPDGRPPPDSFAEYNRRALAGEEVTFERRIRRPSGEERVARVNLIRLESNVRLLRTSYVDITDQLATEARLSEVLRSVVDREEEERRRIARELHDSLGQYLAVLNIKLDTFDRNVPDASPLKAGLADLKTLTATIGNEVGRLAWEMRPTALDDIGLEVAVRQILEEWGQRSGMRFDAHFDTKGRRLPPGVETTLYRVLQEGITNIAKHARAGRVGVIVKVSADDVVMIIEDDGVGFDQEALARASSRLGLLGMRERLAAIRGGLEIESRPGEGTTLIIRVKLDGRPDACR